MKYTTIAVILLIGTNAPALASPLEPFCGYMRDNIERQMVEELELADLVKQNLARINEKIRGRITKRLRSDQRVEDISFFLNGIQDAMPDAHCFLSSERASQPGDKAQYIDYFFRCYPKPNMRENIFGAGRFHDGYIIQIVSHENGYFFYYAKGEEKRGATGNNIVPPRRGEEYLPTRDQTGRLWEGSYPAVELELYRRHPECISASELQRLRYVSDDHAKITAGPTAEARIESGRLCGAAREAR